MSADGAKEDACREYQSSLEDLTFNSKPHINMLTILAEENLQFAEDIVAIIEAQIAKAPAAEKLPVLYLVDSIVKNVGGPYLQVFAKNLITSFICVFEKVDENTRKSLFKLRSTWDDIFPLKKLYALDVRVNSADPAWPIKPLPPNVNASIHVNPKFLKPTEEVAPQPPVSEKNVAEEQIIRQQLLAKQKQLLELQQKKIELELEQTKAQLAASTKPSLHSGPAQLDPPVVCQPAPTQHKSWHPPRADKPPNRDPRLNRASALSVNTKDQGAFRKEGQVTPAVVNVPEKRVHVLPERPSKLMRIPKKDTSATDEKAKPKMVSPLSKGVLHKSKDSRLEHPKTLDVVKKDPRLRKQMHEKTDPKDAEVKEKKRSTERKEREEVGKILEPQRSSNSRSKLANVFLNKHERFDTFPKQDIKVSKSNIRKRSRSKSRSPPQHSPKRKERRSPKRRTRSISPPSKSGKVRQLSKHIEGDNQHANAREDRSTPKKNISELRRLKRPLEDRTTEHRDVQPQRASPVEHKSAKDMKRWRSGWEENKPVKQPESVLQRHKAWNSYQRPPAPRTAKPHRLSVDANLQIPDVLHSASKREILRKASQRLAAGELTQEEFLNVAHQINQLIQYQEEKQRSDSWDGPNNDGTSTRKKPPGHMSDAERSYLEHKSKLRRTQLHFPVNQSSPPKEIMQYNRLQQEHDDPAFKPFSGPDDLRRNDRPPSQTGLLFRNSPSPAGCEANTAKSSLSFEGSSQSMDMEQLEDGDISPRFESPNSVHSDTGPDSDAPVGLDPSSRHEVMLGTGRDGQNLNESPGQTPPHVAEGPKTQVNVPRHDCANVPARFDDHMSSHSQFEGVHGLMGQARPEGPSRPNPPGRFEGNSGPVRFDVPGAHAPVRIDGHGRYDGPVPHRFERPPLLKGPGRYDNQSAQHRPMRFTEPHGRFEGQGSGRFDSPMGHQGPGRFEGPGPMRYNSPMHLNRFDSPARFDNPRMPQGSPGGFDAPVRYPSGMIGYEGPRRLEGPANQSGMIRFDNPTQQAPIRFEGQPSGIQRFDSAPQGPPRYCGPTNLQNSCRPQKQIIIDQPQNQGPILNSGILTHNFNMGAFDGQPLQFHIQQNVAQGATFNVQEPTPSGFQNSYRPVAPFPGATPANPSQPMPVMPAPLQNFGPLNPAPFNPAGSQFVQPESHLGQMDVNDLMTKLIDFGIIKPTQTDLSSESTPVTRSRRVPEEEEPEEEEQEEDDTLPDLTGFVVEDMKQRHESLITKLYTGIQCYSCGMRFTASQTDIYADHLDWHYRQNRSEKDISRKVTHRRWYYSLTDWIEFEEIADLEERAKSQFFEKVHEEVVQKNQEAAKEREFQSVKAAADVVHECCEICQEQFEMYWEEDEEEWHLKNAIRVDEKAYHPLCYEDYKNTSSFVDFTPSPNKMLTENPLNAFLKQESEGEVSCSSIKEEPAEREIEAVTVKQEVQDETEGESQTLSAIPF